MQLPLPKLPVPDLRLSFEKYLRCVMPIVDAESYERTEKLVEDFIRPGGLGEMLQKKLFKIAEEKDNWVNHLKSIKTILNKNLFNFRKAYDWWLNDMYLYNKLPLPINSNPGMVFPKQYFRDEDSQLR